jgi:prepilin-type N-terminal cleavage/methylation domain-containing protein
MTVWTKTSKKGFTLVETIVASVILSGAVLTVAAISTQSLIAARLNRQYEVAASLIDKQLSLIDYVGIDEFVEMGQLEGVFPDFEPGYRWQVTTEYQDIDSLYLVTITVTWFDRNRTYSLTVETMLDGVSVYANAGTVSQ